MSDFSNYVQREIRTLLTSSHRNSVTSVFSNSKNKKYTSQTPNIKSRRQLKGNYVYPQLRRTQNSCRILRKTEQKKNIFYQNMFEEEKVMNMKQKLMKQKINVPLDDQQSEEIKVLWKKLQQIKRTRIDREKYLYEISNKAERLQKLLQYQEKYLKSKELEKQPSRKSNNKTNLLNVDGVEKKVIKENRRKTVHTMMTKHNNFIN